MRLNDFEEELRKINPDLSIRPNNPPQKVIDLYPDVTKIASIVLRGAEVCSIPNGEIYDEPSGSYGLDLRQDGNFRRHRTRPEALQMVRQTLERLENDKEFYQDFFGVGESSAAALMRKDEPVPELVEEVTIEPQEIKGGMIEGAK